MGSNGSPMAPWRRPYAYILVAVLACSLPYIFVQPVLRYRYMISTLLIFCALDGAFRPRIFRPPYGSFNQATLQILRAQRLLLVLWSADTKDYARPGLDKQNGAHVVFVARHDLAGDRS